MRLEGLTPSFNPNDLFCLRFYQKFPFEEGYSMTFSRFIQNKKTFLDHLKVIFDIYIIKRGPFCPPK